MRVFDVGVGWKKVATSMIIARPEPLRLEVNLIFEGYYQVGVDNNTGLVGSWDVAVLCCHIAVVLSKGCIVVWEDHSQVKWDLEGVVHCKVHILAQ